MPLIHIDGRPYQARIDQTVLQVADENGIVIPRLCWHPQLSISGSCRICVVQVEGRSWVEISCNMPVSEGLRVLTDTPLVQAHRKATMQFLTLNHPVDCGVCDKAGECTLQDYHVAYNGQASTSHEPKVVASKFYNLSQRIVLDNERCILCTRCVRFTREVSKSHALGVKHRGDQSLIRPAGDPHSHALDADAYSDNIIDICPVGALLSRRFLYQSRVWYLQATPSVCPGCERGCAVDLWHRKPEWRLHALDARHNRAIERVTARDNPAVNGPWICNKGRDLATLFERPRALSARVGGREASLDEALVAARKLFDAARHPVALISSWASNEELQAFKSAFGERFACFVKRDHLPVAGEVVEDALLIRADKNPNGFSARALFGAAPAVFAPGTDLVLVWGQGCDFGQLPPGVPLILLDAFQTPDSGRAAVFFATSLQTERAGHYSNFEGVVSAFEPCFPAPDGVVDAESLFAALATASTLRESVTP